MNKRSSSNITPYKMPQSRILYDGSRNDYPAFWNRFCQKLSEEGIYYVLEPNSRHLTVGNAPTFPAMPELNEIGQMTPVVRHAHEERMENYKIQMRTYTEAARKLDRDCGTTGILLSLLSPSILSSYLIERNRVINDSLEAEFNRLKEFVAATYGPQSMVDVGMLRQSITDLTDKDGSVVLMAKVEELQNQLRQFKVKEAEGNVFLDAEGNERNHAMTDAEL
jgi:hypothetical protein